MKDEAMNTLSLRMRLMLATAAATLAMVLTPGSASAHEAYANKYWTDLIEIRANISTGTIASFPQGQTLSVSGYCRSSIAPMNSGGSATDLGYMTHLIGPGNPAFTEYSVHGDNWQQATFNLPFSEQFTVPLGYTPYACVTHSTNGDIEVTDSHGVHGVS
jgi:hypothetical protein